MGTDLRGVVRLAEAWADWMWPMAWQVALLVAVVWVLTTALRRANAALRYALWLLIFIKLVLPPTLGAPWSAARAIDHYAPLAKARLAEEIAPQTSPDMPPQNSLGGAAPTPRPAVPASRHDSMRLEAADPSRPSSLPPPNDSKGAVFQSEDTIVFSEPPSSAPTPPTQPIPTTPRLSRPVIAMGIWAAGAVGLLSLMLFQWRRHARRVLRDSQPAPEELQAWARTQAARFNLHTPAIRISPHLKVPCVYGLWRPTVILPHDVSQRLAPGQQVDLIAHEFAHIKRCDLQAGWFASALLCLYWFHPAVWLASLYLRREREMACDDKVLYVTRRPGNEYASTMLRLAEGYDGAVPAGAGFLGLFELADNLLQRIRSVADMKRSRRPGWRSVLAVVLLALVLIPMGSWEPALAQAASVDQEIEQYYAKADPDVKDFIRMTAEHFGPQGLWVPQDHFANLPADGREAKANELLQALQGKDEGAYYTALAQAGALADPRFLQPLIEVAWDMRPGGQDNRARWMAVAALGRLGDKKAVPILIPLVDHYNKNARMWARASLVRLTGENFGADKQAWVNWANAAGPDTAINPAILEWASRQSEERMKPILEQQQQSGGQGPQEGQPDVAALQAALEKEIAEHYAGANPEALEFMRGTAPSFGRGKMWLPEDYYKDLAPEQREERVKYVAKALEGEYGRHQCLVLAEAGALKDPRLLPSLMKMAGYHRDDQNYDCRPKWIAVASLNRYEEPTAAPLLIDLVDHGNKNVQMWAQAGMTRLTGQNFAADKKAWAEWWNANGKAPKIDVAQLKPWKPIEQQPAAAPITGKRNWGPEQATGAPDTPRAGDIPTAWASLSQDDQVEWLLLDYDPPVDAVRILVHETYNPGALNRVTLIGAGGLETEIWKGTDPTTPDRPMGVSEIRVPTGTKIQHLKLYLDSPAVRGWNEIDAVGLVDASGQTHWADGATASSTFAQQSPAPRASGQPQELPQIVSTQPAQGAIDVDPAITAITVTFDREMAGGFSWTGGGEHYPPTTGRPSWSEDMKTCTLPVKLEPGKYYRVGINSKSHQNFRSAAGVPVRPTVIAFATQGASPELQQAVTPPQIVSLDPPNGATNVNPSTDKLTVTFDRPMGGGFSWTGSGENYPETTSVPSWSEDQKSCTLSVKLTPNRNYRLGLNSPSHNNFQSAHGVPLDPVQWTFQTAQ